MYAQAGGRGFIRGLGGVTLGGADTSMAGGGGFGVRLNKHLDIFAEAGVVENVLTTEIQDEIDAGSNLISALEGVPVNLDVKLPNQYGIAGFRVTCRRGALSKSARRRSHCS